MFALHDKKVIFMYDGSMKCSWIIKYI